jgi:hypothetical protein
MSSRIASEVGVWWVSLDELMPAEKNPVTRTKKNAIREFAEILQSEGWSPYDPVKISTEGVIGDGNRRYHAARLAGLVEITAVQTPYTFERLIAMNRVSRRFSNADWLQVYVNTDGKVQLPRQVQPKIAGLQMVLGIEGLRQLASENVSPDIWHPAFSAASYVSRKDNAFLSKIIIWALRHNMRRILHDAVKMRADPRLIVQAVEHDYPLRLTFAVDMTARSEAA